MASSICYFADVDLQQHRYYWFTPFQYIGWRRDCYGKTAAEARAEFVWLRDVHELIQYTDGGERLFLIDVDTVLTFQHWADRGFMSVDSCFK